MYDIAKWFFKVLYCFVIVGGDLLGSMADAVENAAVIILCVSQKYKESNNCRGGKLLNC